MADYSNIKRVVIRKLVGLRESVEAFEILAGLNKQIDIINTMIYKEIRSKWKKKLFTQ